MNDERLNKNKKKRKKNYIFISNGNRNFLYFTCLSFNTVLEIIQLEQIFSHFWYFGWLEYQKRGLITLKAIQFYFFKWNIWLFCHHFPKKRIQPPHHPYICTMYTVHGTQCKIFDINLIRLFSLASLSEWVVFLYVIRMQNKYCIKIQLCVPCSIISCINLLHRCGKEMAMLKRFFFPPSYFVHLYV